MPALDYIRIVGISEAPADSSRISDVTFDIEHSGDSDFSSPKRGIITLRFSELVDTRGMNRGDIERIADRLVRQTLIREKDEDGTVSILHFLGLPLAEWLVKNTPLLNQ